MKFRTLLLAATALTVAGTAMTVADTAGAAENYRIGGGPSGGAWHPSMSAGTQLANKELGGKYRFQYSPSNQRLG